MKKRIFLICPVRNVPPEEEARIAAYVAQKEREGYLVHYPKRDTPQDDPIGFDICETNCRAIIMADEIHVWYSKTSTGSIFDFGSLFMWNLLAELPRKKLVIANPEELQSTEGKSFENVLLACAAKWQ